MHKIAKNQRLEKYNMFNFIEIDFTKIYKNITSKFITIDCMNETNIKKCYVKFY